MTNLTFSHGHALLVGVGGADIAVTVKDATALQNVLVDPTRAAYPAQQVTLLTETTATRQNILAAFDRLIARVNTDQEATVIVYFSGHGWRVTSLGNPPDYFLMPYGYNLSHLAKTAISGREFTDKIEAIKARKLVVLLDCCHAGGVPQLKGLGETIEKAPLPPELLSILETGSGRVVVASSLENEKSYTGTPYSVFTACLMEALAGKAAVKKDGFARILDVLIYLLDQVPQRAAGSQHPFVNKADNLSDNFSLCYYAGGSKSVPGEAVVSESVAVPLTAGKRARLEQELKDLQGERELLAEKVRRIRRALIIEANVVHRFQLEQQLQEEEASLTRLDGRIDKIEQILIQLDSRIDEIKQTLSTLQPEQNLANYSQNRVSGKSLTDESLQARKYTNALDATLHHQIVQILEGLPTIASFQGRNTLLIGLPRNIIFSLHRDSSNDANDLENMLIQLDALGPLETGEQPLIIFMQNALKRAEGLVAGISLNRILEELKRRYGLS